MMKTGTAEPALAHYTRAVELYKPPSEGSGASRPPSQNVPYMAAGWAGRARALDLLKRYAEAAGAWARAADYAGASERQTFLLNRYISLARAGEGGAADAALGGTGALNGSDWYGLARLHAELRAGRSEAAGRQAEAARAVALLGRA